VFPGIFQKVDTYVRVKVIISILTGALTGIILTLLDIELATIFGVLAFVFNFIPNIGSTIAILLPLPVSGPVFFFLNLILFYFVTHFYTLILLLLNSV
jgi:AI-2 transport protein TqsA